MILQQLLSEEASGDGGNILNCYAIFKSQKNFGFKNAIKGHGQDYVINNLRSECVVGE
jgi:hypothetical protein